MGEGTEVARRQVRGHDVPRLRGERLVRRLHDVLATDSERALCAAGGHLLGLLVEDAALPLELGGETTLKLPTEIRGKPVVPSVPLDGISAHRAEVARRETRCKTDSLLREPAVPRLALALEGRLKLVEGAGELRGVVDHRVAPRRGLLRLLRGVDGDSRSLGTKEPLVRYTGHGHEVIGVGLRDVVDGEPLSVALAPQPVDRLKLLEVGPHAGKLGLIGPRRLRLRDPGLRVLDLLRGHLHHAVHRPEVVSLGHLEDLVGAGNVAERGEDVLRLVDDALSSGLRRHAHRDPARHHRDSEPDRLRGELVEPGVEVLDRLLEIKVPPLLPVPPRLVEIEKPLGDVRVAFLEHLAKDAVIAHTGVEGHDARRVDAVPRHVVSDGKTRERLVTEVLHRVVVRLARDTSRNTGRQRRLVPLPCGGESRPHRVPGELAHVRTYPCREVPAESSGGIVENRRADRLLVRL